MAKPRSMKRDVDKAKKERAAMKRERRQRPAADKVEGDETSPAQPAAAGRPARGSDRSPR